MVRDRGVGGGPKFDAPMPRSGLVVRLFGELRKSAETPLISRPKPKGDFREPVVSRFHGDFHLMIFIRWTNNELVSRFLRTINSISLSHFFDLRVDRSPSF